MKPPLRVLWILPLLWCHETTSEGIMNTTPALVSWNHLWGYYEYYPCSSVVKQPHSSVCIINTTITLCCECVTPWQFIVNAAPVLVSCKHLWVNTTLTLWTTFEFIMNTTPVLLRRTTRVFFYEYCPCSGVVQPPHRFFIFLLLAFNKISLIKKNMQFKFLFNIHDYSISIQ